jgi:hypothetical protein
MITIAQCRRSCRTMVLRAGTMRPSPVRSMDTSAPGSTLAAVHCRGESESAASGPGQRGANESPVGIVVPTTTSPTPYLPFGTGCGHARRAELLIDCEKGRTLRTVLLASTFLRFAQRTWLGRSP